MGTPRTGMPSGRYGAVITGGGGGLGVATARELVRMGYRVWLADLDLDAAREGAATLGERAVPTRLDVVDADACRVLALEVEREVGLALWVNGAGLLRTGPSWELRDSEVDRLFAVNVQGTINGTRAALEIFRRTGHGHVVNVVSLAGLVAPPGETVYAATKHAALAYTLGTGQDLRQHGYEDIHLSAVCPDGIWTPMLHGLVDDPEAAPSWSGVLLTPEQAASTIASVVRRPRPVRSVPRWRGGVARFAAAAPGLALRAMPALMAQARRKQARFRQRLLAEENAGRPRTADDATAGGARGDGQRASAASRPTSSRTG
jgi:NAD(P)-dependent dehydrogenase (short-subunit alcohol dehydrogenase family)